MGFMKINKYEHACLVIEESGEKLIIDPGLYTQTMVVQHNVSAIVLTHMHDDHCSEEQLDKILALNPSTVIYGTDEVRERLAASRPDFVTIAVHHGDFYQVGPFTLEFFGDLHAQIHPSIPLIQNCGVMVNNKLYYPGDSFTLPDRPVEMLACPSSAPWLKVSEIMDFVNAVRPSKSMPTHNVHLSELGHQMYNGRIKTATEKWGGTFEFLQPGDATTV
jgi:L-ascorbate metabolism protein UlaG (beta-lactamase superfamily)